MLSSEIPTLGTCCFKVRLTEQYLPDFTLCLLEIRAKGISIFYILSLLLSSRKDDKKKDMK